MSRGEAGHLGLQAAIARIEAGARPGTAPRPRPAAIPLGAGRCALDLTLGGGLRRGGLHEVVPAGPRDEAAACGFALALAVRCLSAGAGPLVWIVGDETVRESGAPYRPGLLAHGLDPDRLVLVRTRGPAPALWAAEEALRLPDATVLAEFWGGRGYGLAPSRRLLLAARAGNGVGLVLHAGLAVGAALSSGSDARFRVAAQPSRGLAAAGARLPVPGHASFAVRLDKAREAGRGVDPAQVFALRWDAAQRFFHDQFPVAVAAAPADRPAREADGGRA